MSAPLILGHRGARAYAPMNTLPAFDLARQQGADGIELDVWLSKDGVPVILHDEHVDETTDGTGSICGMTLAEIERLDAGRWYGEAYAGTRIPTLQAVFARYPGWLINVEVKAAGDGEHDTTDGVEAAVAALIRQHDRAAYTIVSSFSLQVLRRFRALMPQVPIGYLYYDRLPALDDPFICACEYLHPWEGLLTPAYLEQLAGWPINTWTVNAPERARELAELGVHSLITDVPDVLRAALTE